MLIKKSDNDDDICYFNLYCLSDFIPFAFRKAKIVYNVGLSECNRVKVSLQQLFPMIIIESPECF